MKRLILFLTALGAAPLLQMAAATADNPQTGVTRFPSSSQLVQLNVTVTDKAGLGVTGLTVNDFSATDNGRVQPITFFQSVSPVDDQRPIEPVGEQRPQTGLPREGSGSAKPSAPSPSRPDDLHYVVILMEPMGFEARHRAITATEKFLRQLADHRGYRVALIDGPRVVQPFSEDIPAALKTLETDIGAKGNPGPFDGLDIAWWRPALDVVNALMPRPGRKTMVRFVDYELEIYRDFFVQPALLSNLAIYPVDARGLSVVVPFGDASTEEGNSPWSVLPPSQAGLAVAADTVARSSALLAQSMLLKRIAKMTGGRALTDNNDLGQVFDLLVESNRGLYVLGYELTREMADGHWHKVGVKVHRGDLEVHVKERYLAPKAP